MITVTSGLTHREEQRPCRDHFRSLLKTVDPAMLTEDDQRALVVLVRPDIDSEFSPLPGVSS